jgi:hypothetical protein
MEGAEALKLRLWPRTSCISVGNQKTLISWLLRVCGSVQQTALWLRLGGGDEQEPLLPPPHLIHHMGKGQEGQCMVVTTKWGGGQLLPDSPLIIK